MAPLEIRAHRDESVPEFEDGHTRLNAEKEWLVTGDHDVLRAVADALPSRVWSFFGAQCLCLRFGNYVGSFDVPHLGPLRVGTGKWSEHHFELMLSQLTDVAASLPFAGYESAAIPYDRSIVARDDVLYHAFVYLRHVLSPVAPRHVQLLPALEAIVRQPHRLFVREHRRVDAWQARRIGVAALRAVAEGREPLTHAPGSAPIAGLRGLMPSTVVEHFSHHVLDTPENRFVKSFLGQAVAVIEATEAAFRTEPSLGPRVTADCARMKAQLRPYARHGLWESVGAMVHIPAGSTVLQQRRGYRDVFLHSHKLRLGSRVPFDGNTIRDLLEVKDIAELYELWCYFEVVAALQEILGRPTAVEGVGRNAKQASIAWGHKAAWRCGTLAYYNLTFSRSQAARRHSYALRLRPDIAVWVPNDGRGYWVALDAKFKLKRLPSKDSDEDALGFKHGDIEKMHVYRDALPAVRSAYALYPGDQQAFYRAPDGGGVGALPALPGAANAELRRLLQDHVAASGKPHRLPQDAPRRDHLGHEPEP